MSMGLIQASFVGDIQAVPHHLRIDRHQRLQSTLIRKNDRVPRLVRMRAKQLQEVTHRLEAIFGRTPSDEELAGELEMNIEEFYHFQRDANASSLIPQIPYREHCIGRQKRFGPQRERRKHITNGISQTRYS
jgi:DNA-directed RNA polymerase specialized sigma subunit